MHLFAELRRRNVIRMAGLYLVGAWLVTQVAGTVLPMFGAPDWVARSIVILLAIGFIPALVVSWVFELTPEGLKREDALSTSDSMSPQTARRMDRMLLMVMALALGYFAFDKFVLAPHRSQASPVATVANAVPAATADNSIAVLPFVDMSQARDQEYFSDGLSEELLNLLAQLPQLRVIARTSSFSFKGKDVDAGTIAKTLKVEHLLEGSVRKSGSTLRITAQLIRASDSTQLWSQTFDRELTDIFKVQDEIAVAVVAALKVKLLAGKQPDHTQRTRNVAAYEQYLLGQQAARGGIGGSLSDQEAALAAFQRAVTLDPDYANAWAHIAQMQRLIADFQDTQAERDAMIDLATASADKAIALAPDLSDGYVARGRLRHGARWDWQGANADLARAIELNPNSAFTQINASHMLMSLGRADEAIAMASKATKVDPLSDEAWAHLGRMLIGTRANAEAGHALEQALELNPQHGWANFMLGNLLLSQGDVDAAIAHYQRAPGNFGTAGMAMAEFTRGDEAASKAALTTMETDYATGFAFQIAQIHAWRGDTDQAFEWLDRCLRVRDYGVVRLRYDPAMDPLRTDPRFAALVAKVGFPP